ncbi:MAG: hypothetical protein RML95_11025 [Anaerolineae bacterium]|nr:hypothetical protein [Anaerolineae bacterium]
MSATLSGSPQQAALSDRARCAMTDLAVANLAAGLCGTPLIYRANP